MAVITDTAGVPTGRAAPTKRDNVLDIIDIRCAAVEINLKDEINTLLKPKDGPRQLPTLLLYDERGLQLFEEARLASPPPRSTGHNRLLSCLMLAANRAS
jgi:hypothetical protein